MDVDVHITLTYLAWRYSSITFRSLITASDSGAVVDDMMEREDSAVMRGMLRELRIRTAFMLRLYIL